MLENLLGKVLYARFSGLQLKQVVRRVCLTVDQVLYQLQLQAVCVVRLEDIKHDLGLPILHRTDAEMGLFPQRPTFKTAFC